MARCRQCGGGESELNFQEFPSCAIKRGERVADFFWVYIENGGKYLAPGFACLLSDSRERGACGFLPVGNDDKKKNEHILLEF